MDALRNSDPENHPASNRTFHMPDDVYKWPFYFHRILPFLFGFLPADGLAEASLPSTALKPGRQVCRSGWEPGQPRLFRAQGRKREEGLICRGGPGPESRGVVNHGGSGAACGYPAKGGRQIVRRR